MNEYLFSLCNSLHHFQKHSVVVVLFLFFFFPFFSYQHCLFEKIFLMGKHNDYWKRGKYDSHLSNYPYMNVPDICALYCLIETSVTFSSFMSIILMKLPGEVLVIRFHSYIQVCISYREILSESSLWKSKKQKPKQTTQLQTRSRILNLWYTSPK